jgi:hypothetical protein
MPNDAFVENSPFADLLDDVDLCEEEWVDTTGFSDEHDSDEALEDEGAKRRALNAMEDRTMLLGALHRTLASVFGARRRWDRRDAGESLMLRSETLMSEEGPQGYSVKFEGLDGLHINDYVVMLLCIAVAQRNHAQQVPQRMWKISADLCQEWTGLDQGWLNDEVILQSLQRFESCGLKVRIGPVESDYKLVHWDTSSTQSPYGFAVKADTLALFENDLSRVDFDHLLHSKNDLAKWLSIYLTCRRPKAVNDITTYAICKMSGYGALPEDEFLKDFEVAFAELLSGYESELLAPGETVPTRFPYEMRIENDAIRLDLELSAYEANPQRVYVITTAAVMSDGFIDFRSRLEKGGNCIDAVVRMKPAKRDQDNSGLLAEAINVLLETHDVRPRDIVAIIRGGGPEDQFTMYESASSLNALKALRAKGAHIVTGVGHTKDQWEIDHYADFAAPVPFAAAQYVNDLLDKAKNRPAMILNRRFRKRSP